MEANETIEKKEWRDYSHLSTKNKVSTFYYENHIKQTFDFVIKKKNQYNKNLNNFQMDIWEAIQKLNELFDERFLIN